MGIFDKLRAWLSGGPSERDLSTREAERRHDNVQINFPDGTMIGGHDAVKAHFQREREILNEHGSSIILQVYRINLAAKAMSEMLSEKLADIKVDAGFVSATDTVVTAAEKVRLLLGETSQSVHLIGESDRVTLFFSGRPMQADKLFYADHYMMLPVWVQVHLHGCEFEEVMELARKLRLKASAQGAEAPQSSG